MEPNKTSLGALENVKVNVKIKLSALWATVMLCYIYGDIFSLFVPGRLKDLMNGDMGIGKTTPMFLLIFAIMMAIPSLMVFLSLVLEPKINRWANAILGLVYTIIIILTTLNSISAWWTFYVFLGIIEMAITSTIVWYALKWPKQ